MVPTYAVVTGGSRGLGLEICKKLTKMKTHVILTDRDVNAGKAAAESLGPTCSFYDLDMSQPAVFQDFVHNLKQDLQVQQIHLLVNNAGVLLTEWNKETFDTTIKINLEGPVYLTRALMPLLKDSSVVINVSSIFGLRQFIEDKDYVSRIREATSIEDMIAGLQFREDSVQQKQNAPAYSISKAALSKATTLMSEESALKEKNISMVSVCPGWCRTNMGNACSAWMKTPPLRSPEEGAESILWPFYNFNKTMNGAYLDCTGKPFQDTVTA